MATQQEVLKNFVTSLDNTSLSGVSAVDEAVAASSNFKDYDDLLNSFLSDRRQSASAEDFLKNYCGIDLDNEDVGAITGADAGGTAVKTAQSIVPESYPTTSFYPENTSFSYKGLTINVPEKSSLTETQQNIIAGIYTWWLRGGLDLVEETYGLSYSDSDATFNSLAVDFEIPSEYSHLPAYFTFNHNSSGEVTNMTYHINGNRFANLSTADQDGVGNYFSEDGYLDKIIARSLSRTITMSQIDYAYDLPSIVGRGISEVVTGGDDIRSAEIEELSGDFDKMLLFSLYNERLDIDIRETDDQDAAMGYMLMRYLAKQTADPTTTQNEKTEYIVNGELNTDVVTVTDDGELEINDNYNTGATTVINNYTYTNYTNYSSYTSYTNFANNTSFTSNFVSFSGGTSQTIQSFITGNNANSNVLYFSTALSSLSRSSSSMTFNSADGTSLQVNNSSAVDEMIQYSTDGQNISYAKVGYAEQDNSFTYEDGVNFYSGGEHTDVLNVTNAQSRNIWLDGSAGVGYDNINNIDASSSSGNNTLAGDAGNNQITAGSGNDSLWGGAGDDVLIGGTGTDEFFFGMNDGNDVAQNVKEGDVVNLYDVTLEQITAVNTESNFISINTATGSALQVQNSSSLTNTFKLADGSAWKFNRASGNWQQA